MTGIGPSGGSASRIPRMVKVSYSSVTFSPASRALTQRTVSRTRW